MIAVIQRVGKTSLTANGAPCSEITHGFLVLLGVLFGDDETDAKLLSDKISKLRVFSDENGKMNRALPDVHGEVMVVSNFTLAANYRHGNRPDFLRAAAPEEADRLYRFFIDSLIYSGVPTVSGVFGADMQILTTADGPVTIVMDSAVLRKEPKQ
ncbi:MAG: D-tyrosyl-tRNA(Tyr) deacylase [Clostridia bacterium]|nr:D-tyrosyl-tRNA(Tyr) deacylase [Clostridia bacterium]MBR5044704.1 D-tyrosyl-tRNA(Tyr) deacylase [Clostridia bacterium]